MTTLLDSPLDNNLMLFFALRVVIMEIAPSVIVPASDTALRGDWQHDQNIHRQMELLYEVITSAPTVSNTQAFTVASCYRAIWDQDAQLFNQTLARLYHFRSQRQRGLARWDHIRSQRQRGLARWDHQTLNHKDFQ
jgi:hypothetical protein